MRIYPHPPHRQHISAHPTHSSQTPPRNHHHPPSFRHKNARLWLISPSIPMILNPPMLLLQQLRARGHGRHWRQSPPTTTRRCMRPPRKYLSSRSSSQHRCVSLLQNVALFSPTPPYVFGLAFSHPNLKSPDRRS